MLILYSIVLLLHKHQIPSNSCKITTTINSNGIIYITALPRVPSNMYNEYYTEIGKSIQNLLNPLNTTDSTFIPTLF
jgi:hypothetical protein